MDRKPINKPQMLFLECFITEHPPYLSGSLSCIIRYQVGDRLRAPDQKFILDKVLYYHPDHAQKVGCGVHYIKVSCS